MRDQISALEALQHLDLEMRDLEDKLEQYPQEMYRYKEELQSTSGFISGIKAELERTRKKKTGLEIKLSENQDSIKKY
jgi:hypothetical protein